MATIYVYLLNEGTDVWRPVPAHQLSDDVFLIDPDIESSDDEEWQFTPGQKVRCQWRTFSEGEGFVAIDLAT